MWHQYTGGNPLAGDNDVEIRALFGDANQSRVVDKPDLQGVKDHAGQPLDQMSGNFLFDLDLDGVIAKESALMATLAAGN